MATVHDVDYPGDDAFPSAVRIGPGSDREDLP